VTKLAVLNIQGEEVGHVDLKEELFAAPISKGALYYTAVAQMSNSRLGAASTRKRGEVRGGGRKPWSQKGTGRARHGSSRSPVWVGGGVTFGPSPERKYTRKVPRKVKRIALQSALSTKVHDNKFLVIEELSMDEPRTRRMKGILEKLKAQPRVLLVTDRPDLNIIKSARNLQGVKVITAEQLNVLDLLNHDYLIMTRKALQRTEEVFCS
jgi:large subunit ribosomal protein L4